MKAPVEKKYKKHMLISVNVSVITVFKKVIAKFKKAL